jgi:hypothetical protein
MHVAGRIYACHSLTMETLSGSGHASDLNLHALIKRSRGVQVWMPKPRSREEDEGFVWFDFCPLKSQKPIKGLDLGSNFF